MGVGDFAGGILYADGSGVAHPTAIGGNAEKIYCGEIGAGFFKDGSNARFGFFIFNQQVDPLNLRKMADDFREGPRNGREFSGPVGEFMGPA